MQSSDVFFAQFARAVNYIIAFKSLAAQLEFSETSSCAPLPNTDPSRPMQSTNRWVRNELCQMKNAIDKTAVSRGRARRRLGRVYTHFGFDPPELFPAKSEPSIYRLNFATYNPTLCHRKASVIYNLTHFKSYLFKFFLLFVL